MHRSPRNQKNEEVSLSILGKRLIKGLGCWVFPGSTVSHRSCLVRCTRSEYSSGVSRLCPAVAYSWSVLRCRAPRLLKSSDPRGRGEGVLFYIHSPTGSHSHLTLIRVVTVSLTILADTEDSSQLTFGLSPLARRSLSVVIFRSPGRVVSAR